MKTSEAGLLLIESFESFRAEAYLCPAGVLTIGYGTTQGVEPGMVVTEQEAEEMLRNHVEGIENTLNGLSIDLSQNQFDALVCFIYNVGIGHFLSSGLLRTIKTDPNSAEVASEFRKWRLVGGQQSNGLIRRREAEINLYQS